MHLISGVALSETHDTIMFHRIGLTPCQHLLPSMNIAVEKDASCILNAAEKARQLGGKLKVQQSWTLRDAIKGPAEPRAQTSLAAVRQCRRDLRDRGTDFSESQLKLASQLSGLVRETIGDVRMAKGRARAQIDQISFKDLETEQDPERIAMIQHLAGLKTLEAALEVIWAGLNE